MSVNITVLVRTPGQLCTRAMPMLSLTFSPDRPLADQIVTGIKRQIDDRLLRPGTRLPSIRGFAESHKVGRFTVAGAYDRLVARGYLQSRRARASTRRRHVPRRPSRPRRRITSATRSWSG